MQVNEEKNLSSDAGQVSASRSGQASDACPACTRGKYSPFRSYSPEGKIVLGCIDDFHTGHLTPLSASNSWHMRPEAKKWRREIKEHLRTLKPYQS